jgi:outer membrane protein TolC
MNLSRYWIRGLALLLILLPALTKAQNSSISLDEAVELFKENSLQRTLLELEQERQKGNAKTYKAFQNPEISVFHESLNAGSPNYDETTIQISQPLELFGQPFLRNKSASKLNEASKLEFQYKEQILIGNLKSLYVEYWFLTHQLHAIKEATAVVKQAEQSAIARREEGSYSGIELQRFSIEHAKYQMRTDKLLAELGDIQNQLKLMVFPEENTSQEMELSEEFTVTGISDSEESLTQYAFKHRADLQNLELLSEAYELKYDVERRERFPDLNIDLGYKSQSNGSEGFVIGGSIKLPIFNQNKGNVITTHAQARTISTSLELKNRSVQNEITLAYQRVVQLADQWDSIQVFSNIDNMLETAQIAYQEGQYSLLELLDATEAYVTGQTLFYETIAEYNQALYKLDIVSGGKLFSNQQNIDP